LRLAFGGGATGMLGGRRVRYAPGRGRAASAALRTLRVRGRSMPLMRTSGMRLPTGA
jgi:hypothetical protein